MNLNSINNSDLVEDDEILNERTPLISNSNNNNSNNSDNQNDLRTQDNLNSVSFVNPKSNNSLSSSLLNRNNVHIESCSNRWFSLYKLWKFTGPGLLISVAYLDPGNLESDLQAGAIAGYKLLWVLMYSTLAGFIIQFLAVRLGSATGLHLAEICHREYSVVTRYILWIMIEIAIIASDIQQVIGSAVAINILSRGYIPIWIGILITSADVLLFIIMETTGIRVVEAIFAGFMALMSGSFLYTYIRAQPDQKAVIEGVFYPWCKNCSSPEINQLVGIIGSIITPHNIYFHSSLVLSRNVDRRHESSIKEANIYYAIESGCALLLAFVVNLFVTSVSAKSLHDTPQANNITLFNADQFIQSQYGLTTVIIWAIGLLSAGQCSTITGTYAGQFIMEGFTKINLSKWKRIILTRSISIVPCTIITLLAYDAINHLNFWCNIVKAIHIPFALLPLLHFTSSKRIMGSFRNNIILKLVSYLITLCILCINIYFLINKIIENNKLWSYILGSLLVIYLLFVIFFLLGVNNIYRITLLFRRIFSPYDAEELDELIRVQPAYKRPESYYPTTSRQTARDGYLIEPSTSSNSPITSTSINSSSKFNSLKQSLIGSGSKLTNTRSSKQTPNLPPSIA